MDKYGYILRKPKPKNQEQKVQIIVKSKIMREQILR